MVFEVREIRISERKMSEKMTARTVQINTNGTVVTFKTICPGSDFGKRPEKIGVK